jgi:hypothetical protein
MITVWSSLFGAMQLNSTPHPRRTRVCIVIEMQSEPSIIRSSVHSVSRLSCAESDFFCGPWARFSESTDNKVWLSLRRPCNYDAPLNPAPHIVDPEWASNVHVLGEQTPLLLGRTSKSCSSKHDIWSLLAASTLPCRTASSRQIATLLCGR